MSNYVDLNGDRSHLEPKRQYPVLQLQKVILLVESRPLMGEIFSHALKEATGDLDIRLLHNLDGVMPAASLAVFSFVQRSSDPLFIAFVVQQLRAKLGTIPLLIITDSADPAIGKVIEEAGIQTWIPASMGFGAIVAAIRTALSLTPSNQIRNVPQHVGFNPSEVAVIPAPLAKSDKTRDFRSEIHLSLTDRELDVLHLLKKGKQNKLIAHALNISESTAKVHIRNIMRKFHLRNRTEVALMCGTLARQAGDLMFVGPDYDDGQMVLPESAY